MFAWLQRVGRWWSELLSFGTPVELTPVELAADEKPTRIDIPALQQASAPTPKAPPVEDYSEVSATRWFMAAIDPADLAQNEGEALDYNTLDDMTDRYTAKEELPDSVRREFSLEE